jgi:hypothetical protein
MPTNSDAPRGLEYLDGPRMVVPAIVLAADSVVLGVNDPVVIATLGSGKLTVARAAADGGINGVIVEPRIEGWNYATTDRRRQASTLTKVTVLLTPPHLHIFRIQSVTGTNYSATLANKFCNLATMANADSLTGISVAEVDLAAAHATAGDLYVLGLDEAFGGVNETGQAHAKLKVRIANT